MKKLIVILFIIFGSFLTFSLYRTFAYDTSVVEEVPSTTDLEYTFKIGNSSIKQITVDSGETKYYDIVLGNPNNAKISYSIYYEMVSPNTKPDGFSIEYTSKSTGDSTGKVDKNGNITLNLVVSNTSSSSVTVKLGSIAGYVNGGELTLSSGQVVIPKAPVNAVTLVNSLDDGTTGDSGSGVYKVTHSAIASGSSATGSEILAVTDYRYYGANANNYICLDMEGGSTCPDKHLYRIIGSIYEENENVNRIKVIKATDFTNSSTTFAWNSAGTNIWATPTNGRFSDSTVNGSSLMKLLNSDLFNTANTYALSNISQKYVNESIFYLGGWDTSQVNSMVMYSKERGTVTYGTDKSRPLSWKGKVGLMYPSDYGYAAGNSCSSGSTYLYNYDGKCKSSDWLFNSKDEWLMSVLSNSSERAFFLGSAGYVYNSYNKVTNTMSVRPVFYLTSITSITGGDGTSSNPYILS